MIPVLVGVVPADPGAALVVDAVRAFGAVTAPVGATRGLRAVGTIGRVLAAVAVVGAFRRAGEAQVLRVFDHF
jgi:hypothetical protein